MPAKAVQWAKDENGNNMAKWIVAHSQHRDRFYRVLETFRQEASPHETVTVLVWGCNSHVCVEVQDLRCKHSPCCFRAFVSWSAIDGRWASDEISYVFARRGWGRFLDALTGCRVPRYADCGRPDEIGDCREAHHALVQG